MKEKKNLMIISSQKVKFIIVIIIIIILSKSLLTVHQIGAPSSPLTEFIVNECQMVGTAVVHI